MNGIYLYLILNEIRATLIGMCVEEVLMQQRIVQFVGGKKSLYVSLFPDALALYVSRKAKQHYEKLPSFNVLLTSRTIKRATQEHFKPVVRLTAEKRSTGKPDTCEVIISLYRQAPNIRVRTGSTYKDLFSRFIEKKPKKNILMVDELTLRSLAGSAARLVKEIEGVDKNLAEDLNQGNIMNLCNALHGTKVRPRLVSALPLRVSLFADKFIKAFRSFNSLYECGVRLFLEAKIHEDAVARKRERIRTLQRKRLRMQKKLLSANDIEGYRIAGELLLGNVQDIKKGTRSVRLTNPYDDTMVTIPLDPHLTAQQNAQKYFKKYKKHKRGQPVIQRKLEQLEREIAMRKESALEKEAVRDGKRISEKKKPPPFRVFRLPGGAVVYVGKSARSNDELTFAFAKPHDYFFHTRGFEGAHTILRVKVPKGQKPSRSDVRAAAAIAAYYSKARRQHNVVVSYTQRKYLKKNKRGGPGSVILMREETLFVDPELPESHGNLSTP